jgi:Zn-finger nucleic acid-binding protein
VLARSTALDLFVDECTRCKGSLLSPRELTRIAEHVTEHEAMSVGRFVPPPPGQEIPRQTMLALVTCPGCRQPMERTNFASYGGLAVDLCATHGMWLDAGELVALILLLERRRDDPDSFREASIGSPFEDPRRSREILAENERRAREDERRWRDESSDDPQLEAMRAQQSDAYNKSLVIDTALEQLGKLLSAWVRMRR